MIRQLSIMHGHLLFATFGGSCRGSGRQRLSSDIRSMQSVMNVYRDENDETAIVLSGSCSCWSATDGQVRDSSLSLPLTRACQITVAAAVVKSTTPRATESPPLTSLSPRYIGGLYAWAVALSTDAWPRQRPLPSVMPPGVPVNRCGAQTACALGLQLNPSFPRNGQLISPFNQTVSSQSYGDCASTKPEIHNISQRRRGRTEPRPQAICAKMLVKISCVVFEICEQTDSQM